MEAQGGIEVLLILVVSQLIRQTLFIPVLLMGPTRPQMTLIDPCRVAAFCPKPQKTVHKQPKKPATGTGGA